MSEQNQETNVNNDNGKSSRTRGKRLSRSEVIAIRSRKIGSDDLSAVADSVLSSSREEFYEEEAVRVSEALKVAVGLADYNDHLRASEVAHNCLESGLVFDGIEITCRDNKTRTAEEVVRWFSKVHKRINRDIVASKARELQYRLRRADVLNLNVGDFDELSRVLLERVAQRVA